MSERKGGQETRRAEKMDRIFTVKLHFSTSCAEGGAKLVSTSFITDDPNISRAFFDIGIMANNESHQVTKAATWEEAIRNAAKPLADIARLIEKYCELTANKPQDIMLSGPYGDLFINFYVTGKGANGVAYAVRRPGYQGNSTWTNKNVSGETWAEVLEWVEKEVKPAWERL